MRPFVVLARQAFLPLGVVVSSAAGDVGLIAIEKHLDGWVLLTHRPRPMSLAPTAPWEAEDDAGKRYAGMGGGGHGGAGWLSQLSPFLGSLPEAGRSLRLRTTDGDGAGVAVTVQVPATPVPSALTMTLLAPLGDGVDTDHRARAERLDDVRSALGRGAVPDETLGGCSFTLDLAVDALPAELRLRRRSSVV